MTPDIPATFLNPTLRWRPLATLAPPAPVTPWLHDGGSLTRRLQALGRFRVVPQRQHYRRPRAEEARLLRLGARRVALVREVLLTLDGDPVVFARSVLPVQAIRRQNRVLGHMARRSLGAELFKAPRAVREQVWGARVQLPSTLAATPCWGRQSRFIKRGKRLLVSEIFLPALWQRLGERLD